LRASVIEKQCKGTAFLWNVQIIRPKSDKFLQNGQCSLQNITALLRTVTFCYLRFAGAKLRLFPETTKRIQEKVAFS
jgi:hypothetical protein